MGRALKAEFTMICSLRLIWSMQDVHRGSFQVTSLLLCDWAAMAMWFKVFQDRESIICDNQALFSRGEKSSMPLYKCVVQ